MNVSVNYIPFTSDDMTCNETSPSKKYERRGVKGDFGKVPHWGQRKLILPEMKFFTDYWDPKQVPHPLCVYAGAASGTHITLLAELFPAFEFHLYDPSPFSILETDQIKIFTGQEHGFFTLEVAKKYKKCNNVFFISDIRTADWKRNRETEYAKLGVELGEKVEEHIKLDVHDRADQKTEQDVWEDMKLQESWVLEMQPIESLLKFRLPWPKKNQDIFVSYLNGIVYWQPWAPHTSTETRLKPLRNPKTNQLEQKQWNIIDYEEKCFYHNCVTRENKLFMLNGFQNALDPPELLNDFDSVAEAYILQEYLKWKTLSCFWGLHAIRQLSRKITSHLNFGKPILKPTNISLAILRSTPFKASNRGITQKRIEYFQNYPEEWEKVKKTMITIK